MVGGPWPANYFLHFYQVSLSVWKEQFKNSPSAYCSVYQGRPGAFHSMQHDSIYGPRSYTWIQYLTPGFEGAFRATTDDILLFISSFIEGRC